jgi:Family of unknown function (DUF5681)
MPSKDTRARSSNYRRPPVEHQFKKGTSGNPSGRPKKKARPGFGASGGEVTDRLAAMALNEATRPVTVREGEKTSEMPAMQALLRTMFRAAAQGDIKAGRQLMDLIARAESQRTATAVEMLQLAAGYKEKYGRIFEEHEREGLDPPDIYPHPDDVIIDETTGEVTIDGPTSKDQAGARKAVRAQAFEEMRRYFEVEAALKKEPKNQVLRREFKELKVYYDFLMSEGERITRHKALRSSRRALEKTQPEDDTSDQ